MTAVTVCKHCGSTNMSEIYTDTLPESGNDNDEPGTLKEVELFDCLDCGELAQILKET